MQRTRNNNRGVAYQEYLADVAAEQAAEKAAADAAQAEADAQDPVKAFQNVANAEAEQSRQLVLSGVLSDEYLSGFGAIVRQPFTEAQVDTAMAQFMAETHDYIRTKPNAKVLIAFLYRNNISPAACSSYRIGHAILKLWAAYPDAEKPVAQIAQSAPKVIAEPVLTPSEQAVIDHQRYCEEIIGHDESGKGWTMQMVDALPSKEMLRLLRLFEQGHRGSNLLTIRREVLDIKQQQDAERDKIAREEGR
jgi:hypothetical protein